MATFGERLKHPNDEPDAGHADAWLEIDALCFELRPCISIGDISGRCIRKVINQCQPSLNDSNDAP